MSTFFDHNETIAAPATAPGPGGISVIRVSGPRALEAAKALFRSPHPSFAGFRPRFLHHGHVVDAKNNMLDECMAAYLPGPDSFTGEDVVEFHCHGGTAAPGAVMEALLRFGLRQAEPGEFTKRAYLAGKIDLTQAEAVAEAIAAPGSRALFLAQNKLAGGLRERVHALRQGLEELKTQMVLAVDFPEDEVECLPPERLAREATRIAVHIRALLESAKRASIWRQGGLAVLAGRVNAGKSSLLNGLLGHSRAIVSATPGTTRDYIEESVVLDGLPLRLADTAGLRQSLDEAEREGLARGQELAGQADLILFVADASSPLPPEDLDTIRAWTAAKGTGAVLGVANKCDLSATSPDPLEEMAGIGIEVVRVSALTGEGIDELARAMRRALVSAGGEPTPDETSPNLRQAEGLRRSLAHLDSLLEDLGGGTPYDLACVHLDAACAELASVTGEIASQDVLERIFSAFCIGK